MRIRGALHVHSSFSHDGTLAVADLAQWYRNRGFQFVAVTEHSQDMEDARVELLIEQCRLNSSPQFCLIPGLEFACQGGLHILGVGATSLVRGFDPVDVSESIHGQCGYVVLAHPKRNGWKCPSEVIQAVDAAELWNVAYDGKFLPSPQSLIGFRRMRQRNPGLMAIAGHDFHRKSGFYDVAVEMDVPFLTAAPILENLRCGGYSIRARLFHCDSHAEFSWLQSARLRVLGWQIAKLRGLRDLLLQRSS